MPCPNLTRRTCKGPFLRAGKLARSRRLVCYLRNGLLGPDSVRCFRITGVCTWTASYADARFLFLLSEETLLREFVFLGRSSYRSSLVCVNSRRGANYYTTAEQKYDQIADDGSTGLAELRQTLATCLPLSLLSFALNYPAHVGASRHITLSLSPASCDTRLLRLIL